MTFLRIRSKMITRARSAVLPLAVLCAISIALATAPAARAQCDLPPTGTMVAWYPFDETAGGLSANLATQNTGVWSSPPPVPGAGKGGRLELQR